MNTNDNKPQITDEENMQYRTNNINSFMDKYYQLIQGDPISQDELDRWIETLPTEQQEEFQVTGRHGIEDNKDFLEFTLNNRGFNLDDNLKENLNEEDYKFWKQQIIK